MTNECKQKIFKAYWELRDKSSHAYGESRVAYLMESIGLIKGAALALGTTRKALENEAHAMRYPAGNN